MLTLLGALLGFFSSSFPEVSLAHDMTEVVST